MSKQRIQKVLAAAGFGARRLCEQMVLDGRVMINGEIVRELPVMVDPERDQVTVDRQPVRSERHVYFILNKPRHVFCTHNDPAGRTRAVDLLSGVRERVFPVGRLDADTMGLLLLTNDGALAQKLTHPRYGIPKTYRAEVDGCPTPATLERLRSGVWLSEGRTSPATISIVHRERDHAILEITLREGRNREVRRMLAKLGHKVRRLIRICMGKISIRGLAVGAFRPLTPWEIKQLRAMAEGGVPATEMPVARPAQRRGRMPREDRPKRSAGPRRKDRSESPRQPRAGLPAKLAPKPAGKPPRAPRQRRILGPE